MSRRQVDHKLAERNEDNTLFSLCGRISWESDRAKGKGPRIVPSIPFEHSDNPCMKCSKPMTAANGGDMKNAIIVISHERIEEIRAFDPRDNALYGPAIRDLLAYIDTQAEALKVAKDALEGFHKYCIKPECQCWACLALARLESLERGGAK